MKDYNFNYILTNLIKGEKCLLAIFHFQLNYDYKTRLHYCIYYITCMVKTQKSPTKCSFV